LLGIERLVKAFAHRFGSPEFRACLESYASQTAQELDATGRLVAALYACMDDFETFGALVRLYFASASFTEIARRLGRPGLAGGFLMHDHARFGRDMRSLCRVAIRGIPAGERATFRRQIRRAIEPFDLAGLGDESRRNWFPVCGDDLRKTAGKIGASPREIERLLVRSGFAGARHGLL
jgi:FADH2 O2-dependent halogenase